jgi:probable rRNA maturation factor
MSDSGRTILRIESQDKAPTVRTAVRPDDFRRTTMHAGQEQRMPDVAISLIDRQTAHAVDEEQLLQATRSVIEDSAFTSAAVSLAVVDDVTIHDLNRRYLGHDWATDVLSFVLDNENGHLEGEVVISADTAAAVAEEVGWASGAEQLLYVIHGALHLVGYNDTTPAEQEQMREAEERYLRRFGLERRNLPESDDPMEKHCSSGPIEGEAIH